MRSKALRPDPKLSSRQGQQVRVLLEVPMLKVALTVTRAARAKTEIKEKEKEKATMVAVKGRVKVMTPGQNQYALTCVTKELAHEETSADSVTIPKTLVVPLQEQ